MRSNVFQRVDDDGQGLVALESVSRSLGMLHFKKNKAAIKPISQCPFPASTPPTGTGRILVCLVLAQQRDATYPQTASSVNLSPVALRARPPAVVTVRMQS